MKRFKVRCIKTFPTYKEFLVLKINMKFIFSSFFMINIIFHIKTPNFHMDFLINHMSNDIYRVV